MKKILLLLLILPVFAQAQHWHLGGQAGVTFSNYKTKTPWKEIANTGFTFGLTAFKQISANYGLNVGLQYIQKGYNHKICNDITDQLDANYVEIPVMLDYTFIVPSLQNWKGHLNLGVYGAYWVSGKYKMKGFDESNEDFDFNQSEASRFDFGPNGGARIEYLTKRNSSMSLDVRYEIGLPDLQKRIDDGTRNTNRTFIVSLSYIKRLGN